MPTIHYTKTYFNDPSKIDERAYNEIKAELLENPDCLNNTETFVEHFSGLFKFIGIFIGIILLGLAITSDNRQSSLWYPAIFLSFFMIVLAIIRLLLEGPSFATYIKKKETYLNRLKHDVLNTSSYNEFVSAFYK